MNKLIVQVPQQSKAKQSKTKTSLFYILHKHLCIEIDLQLIKENSMDIRSMIGRQKKRQ